MKFAFPKDAELTPHLAGRINYHIKQLKRDERSIYYRLLERYFEAEIAEKRVEVFPLWLGTTLKIIAVLFIFFILVIIATRVQVKRKTKEIRTKNEALQASENRFQSLVENMHEILYSSDEKGIVTYVSPIVESLTGYKPSEVIGRHFTDFVFQEDMPVRIEQFEKVKSGVNEASEYRYVTKTGEILWMRTTARPIIEEGRVTGIQGILTDITERKKAEEEIKSHQEHIELINKILRHDLTNDLAVIRSAISLYRKSPEEELLEEISSNTDRSLDLIKRMRGLESFMLRHRELKMYDIREAIEKAVESYPSIAFEIEGKAQVLADDFLSSVIDNTIRNAVIHGKADSITLTIVREGDMCEVRIADNGAGIPDEIKEKIFEEEFTHGDATHTGIGLYIVHKAMKFYGGYARVEDNKPKGAVFVLKFRGV